MNLRFIHSHLFYKILFVISLAILLFISAITYKHITNISKSTHSVVQSYKATLELEQLMSYIKDAETGVRGFAITRDSIFLQPYLGSREKINNSFIVLRNLSAGNELQLSHLNMLYVLVNRRYENFNNTLEGSATSELSHTKKFEKSFILGKVVMDSIRSEINKMIVLENKYLKDRNKVYAYQIFITPIFTITIIFLTLSLIILSYIKINRDLKVLQVANDKLLFSKESSDQSEILGNYSSWIWNLDTNKLTFSDNQYRLLGCEPGSFEAVKGSTLRFVHPEDLPIIDNALKKVIKEEQFPEIEYRIIRDDNGEIRHIKTVGKLIHDSFGNRNIIGTNSDVTQERVVNIKIEERNRELERSNQELASFNHVASHDLQEPLRKIQTFISRFSEEDRVNLSESAKTYLLKIEDSATRMRILIDDLLLFSRTNKSEKVFYKADLNEIFETTKLELSQVILDKKAKVTSDNLPELNVIPFQIQQLFNNLIGNSLKYSRPDVPVEINVSCEKIIASDEILLKNNSSEKFYKISFIDNGMGFEQEFSEKIFVLFNRLHPNNEFQGTGIGLTICKKIAENHKGFIFAEGTLNQGATFTLFLPENS